LPLRDEEKDTVGKILDLLERNLVNEVNVVYEREKLMLMKQEQGESANEYVNRMRETVNNCQYGELVVDTIMCDRLMVTVRDLDLRKAYTLERIADQDQLMVFREHRPKTL
jgi:hypothetical protein